LLAIDDIALEEDEPPGPRFADERALVNAERGGGATADESADNFSPATLRATGVNPWRRSNRRRSPSA
jgi:hypothetical protein